MGRVPASSACFLRTLACSVISSSPALSSSPHPQVAASMFLSVSSFCHRYPPAAAIMAQPLRQRCVRAMRGFVLRQANSSIYSDAASIRIDSQHSGRALPGSTPRLWNPIHGKMLRYLVPVNQ
ncbi:unnamed protein product [Urochloa humidicola]